MAQQKVTITIPSKYKPKEREAIAQEIIDYIVERTVKKGEDKRNKKFKGYSKSYMDSPEFAGAGKKKGKVDLTLSGDMLEDMELLTHRSGSVTIGYKKGYEGEGKVEGNRKGTYGQKKPKEKKPRDFLGITKKDTKKVLKKYPLRKNDERAERVREMQEMIRQANEISAKIKLAELESELEENGDGF